MPVLFKEKIINDSMNRCELYVCTVKQVKQRENVTHAIDSLVLDTLMSWGNSEIPYD